MQPDGGRLEPGVYEMPITERVRSILAELDESLVRRAPLSPAEAPDRVALHLRRAIERSLASIPEDSRVSASIDITAAVLAALTERSRGLDFEVENLVAPGQVLESIGWIHPVGGARVARRPIVSLLDTTLFTNATGEPTVNSQLQAEINSADGIDVLVAFIRRSGIKPLVKEFQRHCDDGRRLRILTTTYTGSTEQAALDELVSLGAEVRVSYDESSTRLHAKAWLFERLSGYSTAYVGSSNLTNMALNDGLEWNVRVSAARNADVIDKVKAVFESYWQNDEFRAYDSDEFTDHADRRRLVQLGGFVSPLDITPRPFQSRLLELVQVSRERGHHRNLIVAATGTGKTVVAALDYVRLRESIPTTRLLFVAHRQEILEQSRSIFQQATKDLSFGELWNRGQRPRHFQHVFASIQTLSNVDLDTFDPEHFDVVIVDEFHHSAADSYDRFLSHIRPRELVGLTATPERADGKPVLQWFDNRIAAELRLWDAINQGLLAPFHYFGIHDDLELKDVPWKRGIGYDRVALTNVITANDLWVNRVIHEFADRVDDLTTVRALGFCVSVEHAEFMAARFTAAGIPAVAVSGASSAEYRVDALRALRDGSLRAIFSVDIFNEGVDVPSIDAILMLRPTESATIFLQQLGRGLRRVRDKNHCVVLDFVGHHRREFRFDLRLRALLGGTRKDIERQIEQGFPFLPTGCYMELDDVASEVILESLRNAIPSTWPQMVNELQSLAAAGKQLTLQSFLDETGLELEDLYSNSRTWSELLDAAGISVLPSGPDEAALRRAVGRLLHVNDPLRIETWIGFLSGPLPIIESLDDREQRLFRMLLAQLLQSSSIGVKTSVGKNTSLQDGADLLWLHPQVIAELVELLEILLVRVDHIQYSLADRPNNPLQVHGTYTRIEILAAFEPSFDLHTKSWREGVRFVESDGVGTDLLAFTLDKSDGGFLPTTMYKDYAISRELIHWESQNATAASSQTGTRYQQHASQDSDVFLFARLSKDDRSFWFLGEADYVSHLGERPMAITWRLRMPLPGDLFADFSAAVA